jgi:hypothetical protein
MLDRKEAAAQDEMALLDAEAKARREFLKTVGKGTAKGATVAPAVAMLLSALSRPVKAQSGGGGGCGCGGGS